MSKTLLAALLCAASLSAHAHRVWVSTDHTHGGEILKAELGYGEFPEFEPIAKERLDIFKPLQLVTPQGRENLVQKGLHNYQFQSAKPVKDGSFFGAGGISADVLVKKCGGLEAAKHDADARCHLLRANADVWQEYCERGA